MNRPGMTIAAALFVGALAAGEVAAQSSWLFAPGRYTHSPQTGGRVVQYAAKPALPALPDPSQTVSRYWRTRTNLRGVDGSQDTVYEVRSFGNTLGGFDAQRERGFDAQLETLGALEPFRRNPYLFFGGMQGFGFGLPGYPAAVPGVPVPYQPGQAVPAPGVPPGAATPPCEGPGCAEAAPTAPTPPPGLPGTAYPYAPPTGFVAPVFPFGFPYPYGYGFGAPPYGGFPGYGVPPQGLPWSAYGHGNYRGHEYGNRLPGF
ncbi:MAG: hypothetical protein AAF805_03940 [Planctomycetota bacterium]